MRNADASLRVESVSVLAGGEISAVYDVHCSTPAGAGHHVVLKIYSDLLHWKMEKEVFVYDLLRGCDVPTPSILFADRSKTVIPQTYVVMTKLEGAAAAAVAATLAPGDAAEVYGDMGRVLRAFHQVTLGDFGYISTAVVDGHPTNSAYMRFQFEKKLREFVELGGDRTLAGAVGRAVEADADLLAAAETPVLCHNDYHDHNVLVSSRDGRWRVTGVVDVENALAGDAVLDLAKTDYYALKGDERKLDAFVAGYGLLRDDWREAMRLYALYHALELWDWFAALGNEAPLPRIADDLKRLARR